MGRLESAVGRGAASKLSLRGISDPYPPVTIRDRQIILERSDRCRYSSRLHSHIVTGSTPRPIRGVGEGRGASCLSELGGEPLGFNLLIFWFKQI
ncbi:hypothetical protein RRG08_019620 [Elysia crispata]|uniref:Uncharacterized protein n=1 Tax=Elysia crispata TaxID=231223 RepID=A0AAE1E5T6_9GAST|nr:hypothetical protein RRG08_019620 [Elysia crispata]